MKYVLFNGCSFTKNDYESIDKDVDGTIKSWPHWASDKLGEDFVCLAECGRSNTSIVNRTIDHILINARKISCVVVSLSTWDRMVVTNKIHFIPAHHKPVKAIHDLYKEGKDQKVVAHVEELCDYYEAYFDYMESDVEPFERQPINIIKDVLSDYFITEYRDVSEIFNDTIRQIINLINICDAHGLPLVLSQGPAPLPTTSMAGQLPPESSVKFIPFDRKSQFYEEMVIESDLFKSLMEIVSKSKHVFLGWPFIHGAGGKSMGTYFQQFVKMGLIGKDDIDISEMDRHPSEKAHKLYGERIIAPEVAKILDKR